MTDPDKKLWKDPKGYYAYLESPPAVAMLGYAAAEFARLGCMSVLDVGCWTGRLGTALRDLCDDYTGFDHSQHAIEVARSQHMIRDAEYETEFRVANWNDPAAISGQYGGVYFGGVTTYQDDPAAWVDDIMRRVDANMAVVQDIHRTDLSGLSKRFTVSALRHVYNLGLPIDDEERQNRQIWTVTR